MFPHEPATTLFRLWHSTVAGRSTPLSTLWDLVVLHNPSHLRDLQIPRIHTVGSSQLLRRPAGARYIGFTWRHHKRGLFLYVHSILVRFQTRFLLHIQTSLPFTAPPSPSPLQAGITLTSPCSPPTFAALTSNNPTAQV
jgi:hypothetical protein